jgi:hypothetical protein
MVGRATSVLTVGVCVACGSPPPEAADTVTMQQVGSVRTFGSPVARHGLAGPRCRPGFCANGGTCSEPYRRAVCDCPQGFFGA